ncbi:MAG: matrixin family metalloprotease [Gemmataceae bacterium]|nr:matrixin family metalloprotease [Gemmataceae bacterium]
MVESLEARVVAYAVTGNVWPHPELITISFQPDGTNLGGPTSNLFATFNGRFGSTSAWQNQMLKAAQLWAQQTNLNFAVVADSGAASGTGSYQQGDAAFGDIRIGGFAFNSGILALGYLPPKVNNYSIAGDIGFNTSQPFNINSLDYDVLTVMAHELGHALGLAHSSNSYAVEYSSYTGVNSILSADDIAGIRSIYSNGNPRSADAFDASSSNGSFTAATNITSWVDATSKTALLTNLDVTSTTDVDYYKVVAPAGTNGTLKVTVQSKGLSLLAPTVKVYNANMSLLKSAWAPGYTGGTATVSINVTAGQQYYILVDGVDNTAFGTGAYAMTLNFGSGASPTVPLPNTQTVNDNPTNGGGGLANRTDAEGNTVLDLLNLNLLGIRIPLGSLLGKLTGNLLQDYQHLELPFVDSLTTEGHGEGCCCAGCGARGNMVDTQAQPDGDTPVASDAGLIRNLLASQGQLQWAAGEPLMANPLSVGYAPAQVVVGLGNGLADSSAPMVQDVASAPALKTGPVLVASPAALPHSQAAEEQTESGREESALGHQTPPPAEPSAAPPRAADSQLPDGPTTPPAPPAEAMTSPDRSSPVSDVLFADPEWIAEPRSTSSLSGAQETELVHPAVAALAGLALRRGRNTRNPEEKSKRWRQPSAG